MKGGRVFGEQIFECDFPPGSDMMYVLYVQSTGCLRAVELIEYELFGSQTEQGWFYVEVSG